MRTHVPVCIVRECAPAPSRASRARVWLRLRVRGLEPTSIGFPEGPLAHPHACAMSSNIVCVPDDAPIVSVGFLLVFALILVLVLDCS